jgi:hypothetical protein
MEIHITVTREDLPSHRKDVTIRDVCVYDFPKLTRELINSADYIIYEAGAMIKVMKSRKTIIT